MNAAPPTSAPDGPATRQAQKIASWVEAGPGQQVARGDRVLELARRRAIRARSTHSSRSSAMCVGGPPKPMQPMRPHSPATVRNGGRDDSSGTRGCVTAASLYIKFT